MPTWANEISPKDLKMDSTKNRLTNFEIYGNAAFFADGFKLSRKRTTKPHFLAAQGVAYWWITSRISRTARSHRTTRTHCSIRRTWTINRLQAGSYQTQAQVNVIEQAEFKSHYQDDHGITHYCAKIALFRIERDFDRRKLFATDLRTAGKLNPLI